MPKITYDPAIRKTEAGSRLYETWKRVRKLPHDPVWDDFREFYDWSMKQDYCIGDKLYKHDAQAPHGPTNTYWIPYLREEISPIWAVEWCEKWDKTVENIRRRLGLPPLKGGKT